MTNDAPHKQTNNAMVLKTVECCGTCKYKQGWSDNAWCVLNRIEIRDYTHCDAYSRCSGIPVVLMLEGVNNE